MFTSKFWTDQFLVMSYFFPIWTKLAFSHFIIIIKKNLNRCGYLEGSATSKKSSNFKIKNVCTSPVLLTSTYEKV